MYSDIATKVMNTKAQRHKLIISETVDLGGKMVGTGSPGNLVRPCLKKKVNSGPGMSLCGKALATMHEAPVSISSASN